MKEKSKRVREKPDCPNLDSIQRKEQTLIKMRQEIEEKKLKETKMRQGIIEFKLPEAGCRPENGLPCKPVLDMGVKKRAKKRV